MNSEIIIAANATAAFFVGLLVGYTRMANNRPAGMRTQAFICAGSAFLSGLSVHIGQDFGVSVADPARLMAQIVTGIGFLGGGVILKNDDKIKGVTTAAMIWYTAVLGIFLGAGYYIPAVTGVFLVVLSEAIAKLEFILGWKSKPYALDVQDQVAKVRNYFDMVNIEYTEHKLEKGYHFAFFSSHQKNKKLTQFLQKNKILHDIKRLSSLTYKPI